MSRRVVAVVGGGVVGLCAAYYLEQQGDCEVVVVDAGSAGHGASWGSGGWIVPSLSGPIPAPGVISYTLRSLGRRSSPVYLAPRFSPALVRWMWGFWRKCNGDAHAKGMEATAELNRPTMQLFDEMQANGVEFRMWRDGMLFAYLDPAGAEAEVSYLQPLAEFGVQVPRAVLTRDEVHALEPALGPDVSAGVMVEGERHVDPGEFTDALSRHLRAKGVRIIERSPVTGFRTDGERVRSVQTAVGDTEVDQILLAAGAWTTPVARLLGSRVPMQAGKGYSFSIRPGDPPRRPLYLAEARVGLSPLGDRLRVAGTMELSGLNLRLDPRRLDAIEAGARRYLADWPEGRRSDEWTGMRPVPPDGQPIVGRLPGWDNAFVSTGHSMLGVTLGPASGQAMATLMSTGDIPEVLQPFDPGRF